ncbi:BfmA/BtgA family mobilization protein [Flagellimonas eckloniae]
MDGFGTIRLHYRTIKRFRRFSRKMTKSYSETLEAVMDFF